MPAKIEIVTHRPPNTLSQCEMTIACSTIDCDNELTLKLDFIPGKDLKIDMGAAARKVGFKVRRKRYYCPQCALYQGKDR